MWLTNKVRNLAVFYGIVVDLIDVPRKTNFISDLMLVLNRNVRYLGSTSPSLIAVSRAGFSPAKRTLYSA
jgi:hypothetical protein